MLRWPRKVSNLLPAASSQRVRNQTCIIICGGNWQPALASQYLAVACGQANSGSTSKLALKD
eukprot:8932592-Pyramimonas_sp.AAC.1